MLMHCRFSINQSITVSSTWYITMSSRIFSVIGDSNIKRHMNPTNCRDRPLMCGAQVLPCGKAALLSEALRSVRKESNVVLLSCFTNFLTSSEAAGASLSFRIEPVLHEAFQVCCILFHSVRGFGFNAVWIRERRH